MFETAVGLLFCWEGSCIIKNYTEGSRLDKRMYLSIGLKSLCVSVECLECGLDPMTPNLVVADAGWTEKTISSPSLLSSLKSYGIPGWARPFGVSSKQTTADWLDCSAFSLTRRRHGHPKRNRLLKVPPLPLILGRSIKKTAWNSR